MKPGRGRGLVLSSSVTHSLYSLVKKNLFSTVCFKRITCVCVRVVYMCRLPVHTKLFVLWIFFLLSFCSIFVSSFSLCGLQGVFFLFVSLCSVSFRIVVANRIIFWFLFSWVFFYVHFVDCVRNWNGKYIEETEFIAVYFFGGKCRLWEKFQIMGNNENTNGIMIHILFILLWIIGWRNLFAAGPDHMRLQWNCGIF